MKELSFKLDCIPPKATHQGSMTIMKRRDGTQFVGKMQSSKGKKTQDDLLSLLAPHRPHKPIGSPVVVSVEWAYPFRKSEPKKNRFDGLPCVTRPDCDNLAKLLLDCMTRLAFWNDDSQVYRLFFEKCYRHEPGIRVVVKEDPIAAQTGRSTPGRRPGPAAPVGA